MKKYETVLQRMCVIEHITPSEHYNVVLTLDKRLFNQCLVLIYALHKNFSRKVNLFVLQSDFSAEAKEEMNSFCKSIDVNIYIIDVEPSEFNAFGKHRFPQQVFYYFKAHELLPAWADRALYIDIDTLPLKDIAYFYDVDFDDCWLAASNEYNIPFFNKYFVDSINGRYECRPFYSSGMIYNTGSLVLNLNKFRDMKITITDFANLLNKDDFITCTGDQFLLNRFTGYNIKLFPKVYYNCFAAYASASLRCFGTLNNSHEVYSYFLKDMRYAFSIIHFAGIPSIKPWRALSAITHGDLRLVEALTGNTASEKLNQEINKYVRIWWEYAQHIPAKNYGELVADSIKLNADKRLQLQLRNDHQKEFALGYANIAPLGKATQSSISKWSQGPDEANCALTGILAPGEDHSFHTNFERLAWWKVDLQDYYKIRMVKLFNRDTFRERYTGEKLEILFSLDDKNWVEFAHPESAENGAVYILRLSGLLFRYVKVQVHDMALHFKRIGVYI